MKKLLFIGLLLALTQSAFADFDTLDVYTKNPKYETYVVNVRCHAVMLASARYVRDQNAALYQSYIEGAVFFNNRTETFGSTTKDYKPMILKLAQYYLNRLDTHNPDPFTLADVETCSKIEHAVMGDSK